MRFYIALLLFTIAYTSCSDYYKNQSTIEVLIASKEAEKGIKIKSLDIKGHSQANGIIKVYVEVTDSSNTKRADTLGLFVTGDGYVVQ